MLTVEALRERRWGWLPALRKALEGKPAADETRLASINDSRAETLTRLLEVATLAADNHGAIRSAVEQTGRDPLHEDIDRLERSLRDEAEEFLRAARAVHDLHRVVEEAARARPAS
jgi:hypothetical protein